MWGSNIEQMFKNRNKNVNRLYSLSRAFIKQSVLHYDKWKANKMFIFVLFVQ